MQTKALVLQAALFGQQAKRQCFSSKAGCVPHKDKGLHLVQIMYVWHDRRLELPAATPVGQV